MPTSVSPPPALSRQATIAAVALMTIVGAGVVAKFYKQTPTVAIRSENVIEAKSSSGSGFRCDGYGSCAMSGSLTVDGVAISTGSVITQTNADARYVNTSGDNMTGALTINLTSGTLGLNVKQTASAATLQAYKRCPSTLVFSVASGSTIATGTATTFSAIAVPESMSGQILKRLFAEHLTLGVTNPTKYKLFNKSKGNVHLNNIAVQVDSAEDDSSTAATAYTLNGTNNIVSGNDLVGVYVSQVSTTAPKGAVVKAEFDCQ